MRIEAPAIQNWGKNNEKQKVNFAAEILVFQFWHEICIVLYMEQKYSVYLSEKVETVITGVREHVENVWMVYCREGWWNLQVNGADARLTEGDLLVAHQAYIGVNYKVSDDFKCVVISISPQVVTDVMLECLRQTCNWHTKVAYLTAHPILHLSDLQKEIFEAFLAIHAAHAKSGVGPYHENILRALTEVASFEFITWLDQELKLDGEASGACRRQETLYREFLSLLETNRGIEREVQWYADKMGLTPKYISTVCKQVCGRSALEMITDEAAREIRLKLLSSDKTIKEIAFEMHFKNLSNFSRYTHKVLGKTPSEIRNGK